MREWRRFLRLTQEEVAEETGMHKGDISKYENRRLPINERILDKIADALTRLSGRDITPLDLLTVNPAVEIVDPVEEARRMPPELRDQAGRLLRVLRDTSAGFEHEDDKNDKKDAPDTARSRKTG